MTISSSIHGAPVTYDEARFRWAVCQIDSLQRLKCERKTIQKALKNLPKTLNETYDRIFLAVPEEERLFVEHAIQWIAHYNELYGGQGIPCEVLIQATEASMLSLTGNQNERFYDKDTLREVCGCLIDVSPEDLHETSVNYHYTYNSVSFAHYSVREYLDSTRTSKATFGSHTIGGGHLKDRFLEITLSEAQHIESNELGEFETNLTDSSDVIQAFNFRLDIYRVLTAFLSLYKFPSQICRHSTLNKLAIDLLDPSLPHFSTIEAAAFSIEPTTWSFSNQVIFAEAFLWTVAWYLDTNTELKHLCNLLLLTQTCRECSPLAKTFLQGKDLKRLLQAQLCFDREVWDIPSSAHDIGVYVFKGSLIEVFAQLAIRSVYAFKLLVEVGAGSFDPSIALLLYIGSHMHSVQFDCHGFCPLQRLLELGADPNLRGFRVTPLQIATFSSDYEGVEMLLKAGAMPNDTGSADGVIWGEDCVMHDLNDLHGASPLHICRDFEIISRPDSREPGANDRKEIEALLLYHGAEAFSRTSGLDVQESRTMTQSSLFERCKAKIPRLSN